MPLSVSRRERKKREARERIQQAALHLFALKGMQETSIAEIMEEADFGIGTFYNYFESKEDLVASFIQEKVLGAKAAIEEILLAKLNAAATIKEIFMVAGSIFEEHHLLLGYFSQLRKAEPTLKVPLNHGAVFREMLLEVIREGQHKGEIRADISPEALLELLHAVLQSTSLNTNSRLKLSENISHKLTIILNGIIPKGGQNPYAN